MRPPFLPLSALLFALSTLPSGCGASPGAIGERDDEQIVCPHSETLEGIDVSGYEPNTDWAVARTQGKIAFAFIKATENVDYVNPYFARDWAGTRDNGIVHGAYHFFRPAVDPVAQADHFIQIAGVPGDGELPPGIDLEVTDSLAAAAVAERALAFLARVEALTGRTPMIYTSNRVFNTVLGGPAGFDRYPLWVAHWQTMCPNLPSPTWSDFAMWQYSATGPVPGVMPKDVDHDRWNGSLADLLAFTATARPLPHENGNEALAVVNWPDGQGELFAVGRGGNLVHATTGAAANPGYDTWSGPATLGGPAACGLAAGFWGRPWQVPELFAPAGGGADHARGDAQGGYPALADFGGAGLGLSHFSTVTWGDGSTSVFARGSGGAIFARRYSVAAGDWGAWQSLGGGVATGASAIRRLDGAVELFATDETGVAWHDLSSPGGGSWHGFAVMAGGRLASRPIPIRRDDGHLELFATGDGGQLMHAVADVAGSWQPLSPLGAAIPIAGEPSAIERSTHDGATREGPEVFVRDPHGRVLRLAAADPTAELEPLGDLEAASNPLAWVRSDGRAEVFAVARDGILMRTIEDGGGGGWSAWSPVGNSGNSGSTGSDGKDGGGGGNGGNGDGGGDGSGGRAAPCAAPLPPGPARGGDAGLPDLLLPDASSGGDAAPATAPAGCSCRAAGHADGVPGASGCLACLGLGLAIALSFRARRVRG